MSEICRAVRVAVFNGKLQDVSCAARGRRHATPRTTEIRDAWLPGNAPTMTTPQARTPRVRPSLAS